MRMLKNNIWLIVVFALMCIPSAYADITHYINNNVGDRASGLAGAYTAISDDTSGCYYNPAGIALSPANKFSASVNALSTSTKVYKGVMDKQGDGTLDWEQESFNLLPNFFGIVQEFGPGMAGFSYAVPDSTQMRQKQLFRNIIGTDELGPYNIDLGAIDINEYDKTYLFGPSYSMKISDNLSVGATLYYFYHDFERIFNEYVERQDGTEDITNLRSTQTEQGIKPILGIIWDPLENVSLGLAISKLWLFDSETETQIIQNDGADFVRNWYPSSEKDKFPMSVALGAAWFYSPSLLFTCDLKYFESIEDKESVFNVAIATEYYPMENLAVRTGIYTDMSNAPDVTTTTASYYDQIDIYGYSLSGTLFSGKSSITLGLDWSFGSGDSQTNIRSFDVYDVEYSKLTFHLSTSFTY